MSINQNTYSPVNLRGNKQGKVNQFISDWEKSFRDRIKEATNSRKAVFTLKDAIARSEDERTEQDQLMIKYHQFVRSEPLKSNDFYKYLDSYKRGKKLKDKYFKHDLKDLKKYYTKIDANQKYFPFSKGKWESYVLYMMLKLNDLYDPKTMDDIFNVKTKDNREYNPLTNIIKPLRSFLPSSIKLVEYDISRAQPTFIDTELNIQREDDIYDQVGKSEFVRLINQHRELGDLKIEDARKALEPIYGARTCDVMTEDRFNNKGKMSRDYNAFEQECISNFIQDNSIKNYVRLHDAIFVLSDTIIDKLEFSQVKFVQKSVELPEVINDRKMFYEFDNNGVVRTTPVKYKQFFSQEDIIRVTERENDKIIVFMDSNNVVKPFNHRTDMASYLARNINEFDTEAIENKIAKDANGTIIEGLRLLQAKELKYYRDPADNFGLPFKNGFCRFNTDRRNIEIVPYKDIDGFFPEHDIQKMVFTPNLDSNNKLVDFERFLAMIAVCKDPIHDELSDGDKKIVLLYKRMLGYLVHSYKNPSFSSAVIFSDENADGHNRKGGRGKSILAKAVGLIQKQIVKGGNEFDPSYRHRFADLDPSCVSFLVDDLPANFKFDDLYTNIVGDITAELKGSTAKVIPFKYAPKFILTTNWTVQFDEEALSTIRRFMEFKFTNYFSKDRTPKDVFGYNLFDDWDTNQWNEFYNFIFQCVDLYLEHGVEAPEYDKKLDNYNVWFHNESVENEFKRIFDELKDKSDGFAVNDFLKCYNDYTNSLRHEKYFHRNNVKKMVNTYIHKHKIDLKYTKRDKLWISNSAEDDDGLPF